MRVRFRFTKTGKVRFLGHRDLARLWERSLRRAALPIAMTEGFSPRPKMHFGLALSTGHESTGEYVDIDFRDGSPLEPEAVATTLTPLFPDGIDVVAAAPVDRSEPSLQQAVTSCSWRIDAPGRPPEDLATRVTALLAADRVEITRERKGRRTTDDLRPSVLELAALPDGPCLLAELTTQPRATRPSELLEALHIPADDARVCRTHQWITDGGAKREPLSPRHATPSAHAELCAS